MKTLIALLILGLAPALSIPAPAAECQGKDPCKACGACRWQTTEQEKARRKKQGKVDR